MLRLLLPLIFLLYLTDARIDHAGRAGTSTSIRVPLYIGQHDLVFLVSPSEKTICAITSGRVIADNSSNIECEISTPDFIVMNFVDLKKDNAGLYKWGDGSATNIKGEVLMLFVTDTPTTPHITAQRLAILNKRFILQCNSNSTTVPDSHNLSMTYEWTKNNRPLLKRTSRIDFDGPSLVIKKFTWTKTQTFRCTSVENGTRSVESPPVPVVSTEWAPINSKISPNKQSIVKEEGDSLNLTCSADCRPTCTRTWKRGLQILSTNGQYIKSLRRSDEDTYSCIISNKHGTEELNVSVSVEYGPSDLTLRRVGGTTQHSVIHEGSSFNLQCMADCRPKCSVTLTKDGSSARYNGTLSIEHVQRNDTGTFICTASNKYAHQERRYNLTVAYPATVTSLGIINAVKPSAIDQGSDVTLECGIDSLFPVNITWKRAEKVFETHPTRSMNRLKHTLEDTVELKNIQCRDMVPYECKAENEYGRTSKKITLNINCAPYSTTAYSTKTFTAHVQKYRKVQFDITANPEPKFVNWSHVCVNETISVHERKEEEVEHISGPFYKVKVTHEQIEERDGGDYTITLANNIGVYQIDYTLVVQVLPTAPTNLTAENITENSVTLNFVRGFDGRAVQHFEAEMTKLGNQPITVNSLAVECVASLCSAEITDMEPESMYYIKLRAVNEVGESDYTNVVNFLTLIAAVKPNASLFTVVRRVLIIVGVIAACILLAGLLYILTCRPCHRKRRKSMRKLEAPVETEGTEETQMDLWETVATDQDMVVYGGDASMGVEKRLSEYKYSKMRVESLTLTTFTDDEPEPRYINFRWENDGDNQATGTRYLCDTDTMDYGY